MSRHTIEHWLETGSSALREVAERPRREAEILLGHVLQKDRLYLITHLEDEIEANGYEALLGRRADNEPIEYITSKVSFYSQEFYVDEGALIPRPETELLVDKVLERLDSETGDSIVEIGVGSGVVSIVLAQHLKHANFIATDISEKAIKVARQNFAQYELDKRIDLIQTDLLEGVETKIDILVSNPPYIEDGLVLEENLSYEPQNALYGGKIGDEILKRLIDEAYARDVRILACEMGYDQKEKIETYCEGKGYVSLEFYKDYANFDRGFVLTLRQ